MRTVGSALLEHIQRQNDGELDHGRDWQNVKCPYCLDNHHLAMELHWAKVGVIPHEVNAAAYYMPASTLNLVYIRCDCLRDLVSSDKPPKTFQDYFGEPVRMHWYGRRLMEHRQHLNKLLQGHPDHHMHQSQAWEVMDGGQVDPPEAPSLWGDDEDLPPF
jgi:hypothetical protein